MNCRIQPEQVEPSARCSTTEALTHASRPHTPISSMSLFQVDKPEDLKDGSVPGVKNAAVRKLAHELGISAEDVPIDSFKFLTRLHYYAADAVTHGPNAPWGEHEIDYILFAQVRFYIIRWANICFTFGRRLA